MAEHSISVRIGVDGAAKVVKALNDAGVSGNKALDRIAQASRPASRWMQALGTAAGEVRGRIEGLSARLGSLGIGLSALGPAGLAAGAALAAVGVGALGAIAVTRRFTGGVVETAAQFENFVSVLKITEGSAEKAKTALEWVTKFASTTPYEIAEVTEAFTKLRAYGLDPTNGLMRSIGDTASAMNKPIMQAVEAVADAVTGENERLKEFGIKARKEHDQITYEYTRGSETIRKTVDASNRAMILSTLQAIFNERYQGAMDERARTWSGMLSNLNDRWTNFKTRVADAGVFSALKDVLVNIGDWLDRIDKNGAMDRIAKSIGEPLRRLVVDGSAALRSWIDAQGGIEAIAKRVGDSIDGIRTALFGVPVAAQAAGQGTQTAFTGALGVLQSIADAIRTVKSAFDALREFNEDSKSWGLTRGLNWLARGAGMKPIRGMQAPAGYVAPSTVAPSAVPPRAQQVGVGGSVDINVRGPGKVSRATPYNPQIPLNINQGLSLGLP